MGSIKEVLANLEAVIKKISSEVNRNFDSIRLVAVSKTKPIEAIKEAYDAGQRHFGENYVQEIISKHASLPSDIKWHFIGHVQSAKVKELLKIPNLFVVESIDSIKLADAFNKRIDFNVRSSPLNVFVQVNTSEETSKSGTSENDYLLLVRHIVLNCKNLKFTGLMTIGKADDDPKNSSIYFKKLAACKAFLITQSDLNLNDADIELSMGMSGDFQEAIRCGSTNVRIGSTIFGARKA